MSHISNGYTKSCLMHIGSLGWALGGDIILIRVTHLLSHITLGVYVCQVIGGDVQGVLGTHKA